MFLSYFSSNSFFNLEFETDTLGLLLLSELQFEFLSDEAFLEFLEDKSSLNYFFLTEEDLVFLLSFNLLGDFILFNLSTGLKVFTNNFSCLLSFNEFLFNNLSSFFELDFNFSLYDNGLSFNFPSKFFILICKFSNSLFKFILLVSSKYFSF